jgi:dienelactone hydrolase
MRSSSSCPRHENRGLNPHIEDIARRFALANLMAFAPDGLTSLGGYPGVDYEGGNLIAPAIPSDNFPRSLGASAYHGLESRL